MKKGLIISMLIATVVFTGCSSKGKVKADKTEHFDFTAKEIVSNLEEYLIEFTAFGVVDNEEKTEKIATYSSITDIFNTDKNNLDAMIHYQFVYDYTTDKVSYISFFLDRNSTKATERYLYHIDAIAEVIDPNVDTDDISTTMEKGFNEYDFAIYKGKNFELNVSRSEEYFSASFTPIKKGE